MKILIREYLKNSIATTTEGELEKIRKDGLKALKDKLTLQQELSKQTRVIEEAEKYQKEREWDLERY